MIFKRFGRHSTIAVDVKLKRDARPSMTAYMLGVCWQNPVGSHDANNLLALI